MPTTFREQLINLFWWFLSHQCPYPTGKDCFFCRSLHIFTSPKMIWKWSSSPWVGHEIKRLKPTNQSNHLGPTFQLRWHTCNVVVVSVSALRKFQVFRWWSTSLLVFHHTAEGPLNSRRPQRTRRVSEVFTNSSPALPPFGGMKWQHLPMFISERVVKRMCEDVWGWTDCSVFQMNTACNSVRVCVCVESVNMPVWFHLQNGLEHCAPQRLNIKLDSWSRAWMQSKEGTVLAVNRSSVQRILDSRLYFSIGIWFYYNCLVA